MTTVTRLPHGVEVNGRIYLRDDLFAAHRISWQEWLGMALVLLSIGLMWAGIIGGLVWLARRWF